jgi:hypothetical protein
MVGGSSEALTAITGRHASSIFILKQCTAASGAREERKSEPKQATDGNPHYRRSGPESLLALSATLGSSATLPAPDDLNQVRQPGKAVPEIESTRAPWRTWACDKQKTRSSGRQSQETLGGSLRHLPL